VASEREEGATLSIFGAQALPPPRLPKVMPWDASDQLDEELAAVGFYLTGHPLQDSLDALRRKHVTLYAEAVAQAAEGRDAFKMAGVVRRRQERASQRGDKFAFVSLSDPSGEYEVMFPPESLRKCREALEPGAAVLLRVRAKSQGDGGDIRLFGDSAEPMDKALGDIVVNLRVHLSPAATDIAALAARLAPAKAAGGGELTVIAQLGGGREVELRLPDRYRVDGALKAALKIAPGVALLEEA
jgi:DNA polymerase-3 subunit alpha